MMIKGIFIIGGALATFAFIGLNSEKVAKVPVPERVAEVKVSSAETFDNDYLSFVNSKVIPDVVINVDTRYIAKISKQDLFTSKSVREIFPEEAIKALSAISETRVVLIKAEGDKEVWGSSADLNEDQLNLIQELDYSRDFYLESYGLDEYLQRKKITYFFSVTAENPAAYSAGEAALENFLRSESLDATSGVKQEKLRAGRVLFTINTQGDVTNAQITSTSGYEAFDQEMLRLIENLPESWEPATNSKGEAISQELTLFFGTQGC